MVRKTTKAEASEKKPSIYLEDVVRKWAIENKYDADEALEKWVEVRTVHNSEPDGEEKDMACYQEMVLAMQASKGGIFTSRPPVPIEAYIVGYTPAWMRNEYAIRQLLEKFHGGETPKDINGRELVIRTPSGEARPVAYNKKGEAFDLKVNKEIKLAVYGAPAGVNQLLFELTISGKVSNGKGEVWLADQVGEVPMNTKVRMNMDISDYGNLLHKIPVTPDGKYFEEIHDEVEIYDVFEEMAGNEGDFVEFADIEAWAEENPYIIFVSRGTVINVSNPSSTGNVQVSIGESVKAIFGKVASLPLLSWVTKDLVEKSAIKKGDRVIFIAKVNFDKEEKLRTTLMNIVTENTPTGPNIYSELKVEKVLPPVEEDTESGSDDLEKMFR